MCDSIAMRGGLGAIIAAMLNCPADDHVQYYGSWALVNLLSGTERLQALHAVKGYGKWPKLPMPAFQSMRAFRRRRLRFCGYLDDIGEFLYCILYDDYCSAKEY